MRTVYQALKSSHPVGIPAAEVSDDALVLQCEIEAFCSNNSHGSTLTLDESIAVMRGERIDFASAARDADGRDVLRTHEMVQTVRLGPDEQFDRDLYNDWWVEIATRHAHMFQHRANMFPGEIKRKPNFANGIAFAEPENVVVLLMEMHQLSQDLPPGLARAIFQHALFLDIHPFADGNGRSSRLLVNAELVAVGEQPCVSTFRFREERIGALRLALEHGNVRPLVESWLHHQQWTAETDWSDEPSLRRMLVDAGHIKPAEPAQEAIHREVDGDPPPAK